MSCEIEWRVLGAKVIGASHIRNEMPCQDAIRIESYNTEASFFVVAAIADGHGSDSCPHSAEGSQVAVDIMHELFADIFAEAGTEVKSVIENSRELRLPRQLSAAWQKRIEELHKTTREDEDFSYTLYGTTALCVVVSSEFVFAMQLGDGDILSVETEAEADPYWLIEPDFMPGNETYSLCMPDCWRYVKTNMLSSHFPELIMLTTDGYYNGFVTKEGFTKAGKDILNLLQTEGEDYVRENLDGWLSHATNEGSGDDISMALVYANRIV